MHKQIKIRYAHGSVEKITLNDIAAKFLQYIKLFRILHTLRNNSHSKLLGHIDYRTYNLPRPDTVIRIQMF